MTANNANLNSSTTTSNTKNTNKNTKNIKQPTNVGVSAENQELIVSKLEAAVRECDHYALKFLLELACQAGIPKEELEKPRLMFRDLHDERFIQRELRKVCREVGEVMEAEAEAEKENVGSWKKCGSGGRWRKCLQERRLYAGKWYVKRAHNLLKMGKVIMCRLGKIDAELVEETATRLQALLMTLVLQKEGETRGEIPREGDLKRFFFQELH